MEGVKITIALVGSGLALLSSVFGYILAIAKMRWELDLYKKGKERSWDKIDEHEAAINSIQRKLDQAPAVVEKRLDKLESHMDIIKGDIAEINGEIKALVMLMKTKMGLEVN